MIDKRIPVHIMLGPSNPTRDNLTTKCTIRINKNYDCEILDELQLDYEYRWNKAFRYTKVKNDTI